jgi:hypothetical protein
MQTERNAVVVQVLLESLMNAACFFAPPAVGELKA